MKKSKNNNTFLSIVIACLLVYIAFLLYIQNEYDKLNTDLQKQLSTLVRNCVTKPNPDEDNAY